MEEKGMLAILFGLIGLVIKLTILGVVILITVNYVAGRRGWSKTHWITQKAIGAVKGTANKVVREKDNSKEEEVTVQEADFDKVDIKALLRELKS